MNFPNNEDLFGKVARSMRGFIQSNINIDYIILKLWEFVKYL